MIIKDVFSVFWVGISKLPFSRKFWTDLFEVYQIIVFDSIFGGRIDFYQDEYEPYRNLYVGLDLLTPSILKGNMGTDIFTLVWIGRTK